MAEAANPHRSAELFHDRGFCAELTVLRSRRDGAALVTGEETEALRSMRDAGLNIVLWYKKETNS
jgi:hypothetical protein